MTGGPEREELPPQPVLPRGSPRLGVTGTIAIVAIAVLLAAGFGLLGGRPESSPDLASVPPGRASQPTSAAVATSIEPRVTPTVSCAPDVDTAPRLVLGVDRARYPVDPGGITTGPRGEPIDIPPDAITVLSVEGGPCALTWRIEVGDAVLEREDGGTDPAQAAQNLFRFVLPPGLGSTTLTATLDFARTATRGSWAIRLEPLESPVGRLARAGGPAIGAVPGCDLWIRLGNGYSQGPEACGASGVGQIANDLETLRVGRGEMLTFFLSFGSTTSDLVRCGDLVADPQVVNIAVFVPDSDCSLSPTNEAGAVNFAAPSTVGISGIAISACATEGPSNMCGTWYAKVDVSD